MANNRLPCGEFPCSRCGRCPDFAHRALAGAAGAAGTVPGLVAAIPGVGPVFGLTASLAGGDGTAADIAARLPGALAGFFTDVVLDFIPGWSMHRFVVGRVHPAGYCTCAA